MLQYHTAKFDTVHVHVDVSHFDFDPSGSHSWPVIPAKAELLRSPVYSGRESSKILGQNEHLN